MEFPGDTARINDFSYAGFVKRNGAVLTQPKPVFIALGSNGNLLWWF
jgi:hypothetical protein